MQLHSRHGEETVAFRRTSRDSLHLIPNQSLPSKEFSPCVPYLSLRSFAWQMQTLG